MNVTTKETKLVVPAGTYNGVEYIATANGAAMHMGFSKEIPGAPVKSWVEKDGKTLSHSELTKYEAGDKKAKSCDGK